MDASRSWNDATPSIPDFYEVDEDNDKHSHGISYWDGTRWSYVAWHGDVDNAIQTVKHYVIIGAWRQTKFRWRPINQVLGPEIISLDHTSDLDVSE